MHRLAVGPAMVGASVAARRWQGARQNHLLPEPEACSRSQLRRIDRECRDSPCIMQLKLVAMPSLDTRHRAPCRDT